jgi:Cu/Ag efflux protein CusF
MMNKKWVIVTLVAIALLMIILGSGCRPSGTGSEDQVILEGEGIFVGQIDSHSVEILIDDQPRAFGLGEGVSVVDISDGSAVAFTYTEEEARPVLFTIKAVEIEDEILQGEGIYTGQIDSHSVEIVVGSQPKVFALSEGVSLDHIEDGSRVVFTYRKEETRPLLLSIEMTDRPADGETGDLVGEGILVGQIDAQSVEILLNRVFMLGNDVSTEGIDEGSLVAFTYSESGQRAVLDSLKAVDEPVEGDIAHGIFIGHSDSQSIEIQYYMAFALGAAVSIADIADGAEVVFTYQEGLHRPVLTSIIAR